MSAASDTYVSWETCCPFSCNVCIFVCPICLSLLKKRRAKRDLINQVPFGPSFFYYFIILSFYLKAYIAKEATLLKEKATDISEALGEIQGYLGSLQDLLVEVKIYTGHVIVISHRTGMNQWHLSIHMHCRNCLVETTKMVVIRYYNYLIKNYLGSSYIF